MIQAPIDLPRNSTAQTTLAKPSGHQGYLDGLRALAALWVVLSHLWISQCGLYAHDGWLGRATNWLLYSHFAVDIFLVLSGFCLALPAVRDGGGLHGGARAFFLRRARRILPPFYAALAVSVAAVLLLQWLDHQPPALDRRALWVNALLLQDLFLPENIFNGPFWSIAVEWRIYFLFPALVWLLFKRGKWAVLAVSALLGGGVTVALLYWPPETLACPWYLFLFALGVCAGATSRSPALRSPAFTLLCLVLAAFCLAVLTALLNAHPIAATGGKDFGHFLPLLDSLLGMALTVLLLVVHHRPRRVPLLSWQPLTVLGTFAYSLYLIHMPCLLLFSRLLTLERPMLTDPLARVAVLSLTLPLIIGLAYLFFLAFEKPFLRRPAARFPKKPGMLTKTQIFADNQRTIRRETETNA